MDVNIITSFINRDVKILQPGRVVIIGRKMNDPKKLYEDLSLESVYDEKGVRTLWKDMTSKNKMEQLQKISSAMLSATNFVYNGEAAEDTGNRKPLNLFGNFLKPSIKKGMENISSPSSVCFTYLFFEIS